MNSEYLADQRLFRAQFVAMASPCEVLMESDRHADQTLFQQIATQVAHEAWRIEHKFSRYRLDNVMHQLNNASIDPISVDAETARLLTFADQCYHLSQGLFDITAGRLRHLWPFGSDQKAEPSLPSTQAIAQQCQYIGWQKVLWQPPRLQLRPGMQLDFGGIGKEYAVDHVLKWVSTQTQQPVLINFGGDLAANRPRRLAPAWAVGIEDPHNPSQPIYRLSLRQGALATSGHVRRFICINGQRYGHILNPHTGWPIIDAPLSVTVAAPCCTEAGLLATLAMLQGTGAEAFLEAQQLQYWCYRGK